MHAISSIDDRNSTNIRHQTKGMIYILYFLHFPDSLVKTQERAIGAIGKAGLVPAPPLCLEQDNTDKTACHISGKIIPPGLAAGQIYLMPFIKHTDQRCSEKCNAQSSPSTEVTCCTYSPGEQGKNNSVDKLIPRAGYQVYGNRMHSTRK